jgi:hypothetical protein
MEELPAYRPVSVLAMVALLAGICSAAALVAPVFWVLPLVAAGLSAAALVDVARPAGGKVGRMAALAGLALALGFGAQALTAAGVSRWLSCRRAEAVARYWLDAIHEGRLEEARSMANGDMAEAAVAADQAVETAALVCATGAPTVRCAGTGAWPDSWRVRADGDATAVAILLTRRAGGRDGAERWMVAECEPVTPSAN